MEKFMPEIRQAFSTNFNIGDSGKLEYREFIDNLIDTYINCEYQSTSGLAIFPKGRDKTLVYFDITYIKGDSFISISYIFDNLYVCMFKPKIPMIGQNWWEDYKHARINGCVFNNVRKLKIDVTYDSLEMYIDKGDLMYNVHS